ncbi:PREDICTED: uncharacterized protein LOC106744063 [Dinoponera quadriceps]|uniref:Uncharacterized protein LOC106744063 n=1 Tax=Dinoponera quadriceps TaxID=609295 RepID=A0A6P3X6R8_DINQU|nr:PREDICTED: uncharacterized protein LOC106744063 [Dinoponera quadriceps]
MQASVKFGCIGKCTADIPPEELDKLTDNISKTLSHPESRKIFKKYLKNGSLKTSLECLALYEMCSELLSRETNQPQLSESNVESLCEDVTIVKKTAEKLDVQEIDFTLLMQFRTALTNKIRSELLQVLTNTINRLQDALSHVHKNFRRYVLEPCPKTLDLNKRK